MFTLYRLWVIIIIKEMEKELHDTAVKLKIRLFGGVVDANMDLNGKVAKAIEKGYELEFIALSDSEKEEIDELMRNTCNIEK